MDKLLSFFATQNMEMLMQASVVVQSDFCHNEFGSKQNQFENPMLAMHSYCPCNLGYASVPLGFF